MEIIGLCEDINDFNFYFYFYNIDYILSLFSFLFVLFENHEILSQLYFRVMWRQK